MKIDTKRVFMAVLTKDENVPINPLSEALWCTTLDGLNSTLRRTHKWLLVLFRPLNNVNEQLDGFIQTSEQ
jgi:hypothetical protein